MEEMKRERKKRSCLGLYLQVSVVFMLMLTVIDVVFGVLSPRREYFRHVTPLDHLLCSLSLHFNLLVAVHPRYVRLRLKLPTGLWDDVIHQKQEPLVPLQTFGPGLRRVLTLIVYFTSDVCSEWFCSIGDISDICKHACARWACTFQQVQL